MITQVNPKELPGRVTKYNNLVEAYIREFLDSEWSVAEIHCDKYKSAGSAAASYRAAIRRMNAACICTARGDRLFLVRK